MHRISRCLCDVPAHHKQQLPTQFDSQEIYYRLSLQTLFFIFYYYGVLRFVIIGTKAQYFASQALKRRDWRFHTQLNTWCQRSSEPHVICDDYEQGPYITFDFENWVQKSEDNFKFEYRYLEDKIF
ncbi:LOW QUALITY PROTEIN: hypothetical protein HZS_1502 [Henneguya salminicola]|nr:LOW QUALITY PROTEIN: hypothetical protein HZS_1502 [Henneguya salminicola]